MDEIILPTTEWTAPEYVHQSRTIDWFWTVGGVAVIACGIAIWLHNYLFAVFLLVAAGVLALLNLRHPENIVFSIHTGGFDIGRDAHTWKEIKGFDIKKGSPYAKLLIQTNKYFMPMITIPLPEALVPEAKESLSKVTHQKEIQESASILFMEKLGF